MNTLESKRYRHVLGHYPTGVSAVTAITSTGEPTGMVVGTFTSVSLDPPLVAFLPDKSSTSWPQIRAAGAFCVNILSFKQEDLSRKIAKKGDDKFEGLTWTSSPFSKSPVLQGVVAWIDCDIEQIFESGDHYIVVGRVRAYEVCHPSPPLAFFRGTYGQLAVPADETSTASTKSMERQSTDPDTVATSQLNDRSLLEEIASAAGAPTEELYAQYNSESAIALALIKDYMQELLAHYEAVSATEKGSCRRALNELVRATFSSIHTHRAAIILYQNIGGRFEGEPISQIRALEQRIETLWTRVISEGIGAGEFRSGLEPTVIYRFIRDATFMAARWYRVTGRLTATELADKYADLLMFGVTATPPDYGEVGVAET